MDDKILEEIKSRLDIVDLISNYVELKKAGQNYKGLCPFHSEKTPSFVVSPDKQIYHCFGCGEGGNIFSFIMRHDNISFPEAVKTLARKAGVTIRERKREISEEGIRYKLMELNKEALRLFQENLNRSKEARSYLEKRGIGIEAISTFSLGYSVRSWSYLYNKLREKGFTDPLMLQAGLIAQGDSPHDIFRGRIIFPIKNIQGDVIAFGGRVTDDSQPKYLNSPDTVVFKKGENLYGLDIAREEIRKKGYVIITEGYLDVITAHQKGFSNTVAPLGTALTEAHLLILKRFTKKSIIVFDGDEAGVRAAHRSIPMLFSQSFRIKILLLPQGEDLDSFLRKNNPELFRDLLSKARSPLNFLFDSPDIDRTERAREAIKMIVEVKDILYREELLKELTELTGFREMALRAELKRLGKEKSAYKAYVKARLNDNLIIPDKGYDEEVLLLSSVIASPEKITEILERVRLNNFRNTIISGIFEKLREGKSIESALVSMNNEEKALISRLTLEPGFDVTNIDRNIEDCIKAIKSRIIEDSLKEIQERIITAARSGKEDILRALLVEKQQILRDAARLNKGQD